MIDSRNRKSKSSDSLFSRVIKQNLLARKLERHYQIPETDQFDSGVIRINSNQILQKSHQKGISNKLSKLPSEQVIQPSKRQKMLKKKILKALSSISQLRERPGLTNRIKNKAIQKQKKNSKTKNKEKLLRGKIVSYYSMIQELLVLLQSDQEKPATLKFVQKIKETLNTNRKVMQNPLQKYQQISQTVSRNFSQKKIHKNFIQTKWKNKFQSNLFSVKSRLKNILNYLIHKKNQT